MPEHMGDKTPGCMGNVKPDCMARNTWEIHNSPLKGIGVRDFYKGLL